MEPFQSLKKVLSSYVDIPKLERTCSKKPSKPGCAELDMPPCNPSSISTFAGAWSTLLSSNESVRRFLILGATGKNPQNSQNSHLKKAPKHQIFSQGAFAGWRGLGFLAARTGIKPRF
jgi:hypothetical protein